MAKQLLLERRVVDLLYDESQSCFFELWKPTTKDMTDDEFKEYQLSKIDYIRQYLPKGIYVDTRDLLYALSNEVQEWTDREIMSVWDDSPLERIAFVASTDLVTQMSVELAMEESTHAYTIKYFDAEDEAMNWILG